MYFVKAGKTVKHEFETANAAKNCQDPSRIPIFALKTTCLRNECLYVVKDQKLWKPTPLFTYFDLVRVCWIKLQVALKVENNLRF